MIDKCKYCGAGLVKRHSSGGAKYGCGTAYRAGLTMAWIPTEGCAERVQRQIQQYERGAKQKPATECQWCGSGVRRDTPIATHYDCGSSWWGGSEWELGKRCMVRCAEQLLKIRKGEK